MPDQTYPTRLEHEVHRSSLKQVRPGIQDDFRQQCILHTEQKPLFLSCLFNVATIECLNLPIPNLPPSFIASPSHPPSSAPLAALALPPLPSSLRPDRVPAAVYYTNLCVDCCTFNDYRAIISILRDFSIKSTSAASTSMSAFVRSCSGSSAVEECCCLVS
ncbi:hypothetical protein glysoja_008985 [Glycine soja]|nr:hypothetical protein glysoja_008985 [Glycine soja]